MRASGAVRMVAAAGILAAAWSFVSCGILTAPVSVASAVATNANFTFAGDVVDEKGAPLSGVVVVRVNSHRFWTPIAGGKDVIDTVTRRADGRFQFEDRGERLTFTFSRDGYHDASFVMDSDNSKIVTTPLGTWPLDKNFAAVMFSTKEADADLARCDEVISYEDYPIATSISLTNLATNGRSGEVLFRGKNAHDRTIFPAGTLHATLGKEPPPAKNARGDIDPADLEIPHHVTLHLPGKDAGFVRIVPRLGFHPIATADQAPEGAYAKELTFDRDRLKAMRQASADDILGAHEYFFFRAGSRYGKGTFSWASRHGKVSFRYSLYIQPQEDNRDLRTHKMAKQ